MPIQDDVGNPAETTSPGSRHRRLRPKTAGGALAALVLAGGFAVTAGHGGSDVAVSTSDQEATPANELSQAPTPTDGPATVAAPAAPAAPSTSTTDAPVTTSSTSRRPVVPPSSGTPATRPPVTTPPSPAAARPAQPTVTGLYVIDADTGVLRRAATGRVYHPAWSPDGSRLLFIRDHQLMIVASDGSAERALASSVTPLRPSWSPDGRHVAFIRGGAVFVVPVGGGDPRQVGDGGACAVAWSPDGSHIAFASVAIMKNVLETVRADGSDRRTVATTISCDGQAVWSPDSTRLGYLDFNIGPAVVDIAAGTTTPLTTQRNMGWPMAWAPDGDEIAFANYLGTTNNLAIARADGSGVRTIASGAVAPHWSPTGDRIAFQGNRNPDRTGELLTHLYVVDPRGQGERLLVTDSRATHVDTPVWAPDGVHIAFAFTA